MIERFERLVVEGHAPPAILIAPDCTTRFGGSQYLDSAAQGAYQSYLADEVIAFVDARYRTIPEREARAVAGHSSGGFGALRLAMDRPDVFAAYGSHAADCAFEASVRPTFTEVAITVRRAGGLSRFVESFQENGLAGPGDFVAVMTIASAIAYAPDLDAPFPHARLPFDIATAEPIEPIWSRWLAQDPLRRLAAEPGAMDEARRVYIDAGSSDEHGLQLGAAALASHLEGRGVPLRYEEFEGGHRGATHRFETSIPWLLDGLQSDAL